MTRSLNRLALTAIFISSILPFAANAAPEKIGIDRARAIAMTVAKGPVVKSELEEEKGGWRYSFDIKEGERIHEIGVDAYTGKIVEDAYEAADEKDDEADEKDEASDKKD